MLIRREHCTSLSTTVMVNGCSTITEIQIEPFRLKSIGAVLFVPRGYKSGHFHSKFHGLLVGPIKSATGPMRSEKMRMTFAKFKQTHENRNKSTSISGSPHILNDV